jgi:hypothetical protein
MAMLDRLSRNVDFLFALRLWREVAGFGPARHEHAYARCDDCHGTA